MPALFAYLCALCLLLGGGYGALNWLAAQEPMNVVAKTRPKGKQHANAALAEIPKASSPASSLDVSAAVPSSSYAEDDKVLSSLIDRPAFPDAETPSAAVDLGLQSKTVEPARHQQTRYGNGEVSADKAKRIGEKADPAFSSPGNVLRKMERSHSKQASRRSGRKLVLMTLRTIQFPDGRQMTQLIPYRGR